jgi:DNA-binding transcriptional LysR family regulator
MQGIRNTLEKTLNLDQLKSFGLVIETGSFSAAADRLGVSQPAVSLQIRQLERRLGVRLVERVGKRARATPAGMELLRHTHHIETAVDNAIDALADHASGVTGRVRLGTGATACLYFLPGVLRALREAFPALSVVVSTGNTDDHVRKVEENSLDLALVTLPAAGRSLTVMPVLDDAFVAIGRHDLAPLKARVAPADLGALPLVLFEPAANTRKLVDRWFVAEGLQPRPVMELGSVEAMKEMVAAGVGLRHRARDVDGGARCTPRAEDQPPEPAHASHAGHRDPAGQTRQQGLARGARCDRGGREDRPPLIDWLMD